MDKIVKSEAAPKSTMGVTGGGSYATQVAWNPELGTQNGHAIS